MTQGENQLAGILGAVRAAQLMITAGKRLQGTAIGALQAIALLAAGLAVAVINFQPSRSKCFVIWNSRCCWRCGRARPASGLAISNHSLAAQPASSLCLYKREPVALAGTNYALSPNLPLHLHLLCGRCFDSIHDGRSHLKFGILLLGVALRLKP